LKPTNCISQEEFIDNVRIHYHQFTGAVAFTDFWKSYDVS